MEHPKKVGDRTTLAVMLALEAAGFALFVPFGENVRYDLVIDDGVRLARVQCKTGRLRKGAVRFNACSSYAHHPSPKQLKRDYEGQIDYFGVYCPDNGSVYLVRFEDCAVRRQGALRVDPPQNSQRRRIRHGADYEILAITVRKPSRGQYPQAELVPATRELAESAGGSGPCA